MRMHARHDLVDGVCCRKNTVDGTGQRYDNAAHILESNRSAGGLILLGIVPQVFICEKC